MLPLPFRRPAATPGSATWNTAGPAPLPLDPARRDAATYRAPVHGGAQTLSAHPILPLFQLTSVELVAAPFLSFREVGRFHQMLADMPAVRAVQLRRLQGGVLQTRLECREGTQLLEHLQAACTQGFRVVSQQPHRIEILLCDPEAEDGAQEGRGA